MTERPRFVELTPELAGLMSATERDPATRTALAGERAGLALLQVSVWKEAMLRGGYLLAAAGIVPVSWYNTGYAWLLVSGFATARDLFIAGTRMKDRLDRAYTELGMHRIETHARIDHPKFLRFARRLGFEPEGVAEQWDAARRDYYLLARVEPRAN